MRKAAEPADGEEQAEGATSEVETVSEPPEDDAQDIEQVDEQVDEQSQDIEDDGSSPGSGQSSYYQRSASRR